MGILNYFKNLLKKEEEIVIEDISFDKIGEWLDSLSGKVIGSDEFKVILANITEQKNQLKENIELLETSELQNKNIPQRHKDIKEANRTSYIRRLNQLLEEITLSGAGKEILEFCYSFDGLLNSFSKDSMRNYYILKEFFSELTGKISANIKEIDTNVKKLNLLLGQAGIQHLDVVRHKIGEIKKEENIRQDLKKSIHDINNEMIQEDNQIKEISKQIQDQLTSDDHKKFRELKNDIGVINDRLKTLELKWDHFFAVIQSALKKYERIAIDDKIIRSYLGDHFQTLVDDKEFKILDIVDQMKTLIEKDKITLKDKKKTKTLAELENIDKESIMVFLDKYDREKRQLETIQTQLNELGMDQQIKTQQGKLKHLTYDYDSKKDKVMSVTKKLWKIPKKKELMEQLQELIKEHLGREVKVS